MNEIQNSKQVHYERFEVGVYLGFVIWKLEFLKRSYGNLYHTKTLG